MLRKRNSRKNSTKNARTAQRLNLESLEARQMLSASGFTPDYIKFLATTKAASSSTNSGYTPAEIRTAYGFSSTASFGSAAANGAGETIAIIDAYNDPNIASDLATFDSAYGIAAPPSFKVVNESGGSTLPSTDSSAGWEVEESLDVEWAHAIAPGANIILVEASSDSDTNLFAAVNYARNLSSVSVISMSWGSDDSTADTANDQALSSEYLVTPSGHQGITFVASTGDEGVANFPAESPNVLAVGGTDVYLNSNNTISSETAWEPQTSDGTTYSGGGGVSKEFSGRDVPDVSYDAGVGYAVYDSFDGTGGWIDVGGTSAGAPQWAALIAIADQGRAAASLGTLNGASQTLAALYAAPAADFHDITVGSTQYESAGPGYDLATGIGTPAANLLIPYLAGYGASTSTGGGTVSAPVSPATYSATAISSSQINLSWSLSSGATGYTIYEFEGTATNQTASSPNVVDVGTVGSSTASYSVTGLAAKTKYAFEIVASNTAGSGTTPWFNTTTQAAAVAIAAPTNAAAIATSSTTATLSWSASAGATGYLIYEKNGSSVTELGSSGTTSVSISGLTPGATESFYVVAYNATSTSAASNVASVTMPKTVALAAPTKVTATATSSTAGTLSWTDSPGATEYAIYYWNGRQAVYLGAVSGSTSSATISGMSAGTTYQFEVVAENSTSSAASGWISLTTPSSTPSKSALEYVLAESETSQTRWVV
ncbi:MAG TPA: fibronectin type III domain-containing protein [Pirellulales bacterium]|nr:fibronectin type III domain-containing protein [Pirellulales bacterium]